MKDEVAYGGTEEFHLSQQGPDMAEIDTLIERSSLGTPAAKSLRERTTLEAVRPILDRANSLGVGPFAIGIEILPHELFCVLTDHYGMIHGRRRWQLPNMEVGTVVKCVAKAVGDLAATVLGLDLPNPCIVIGLSLGGPVDPRAGTVILYENNPTDPTTLKPDLRYRWEGVKLAELVEQETGCRTVLENDASALAAYEQKFGVGQEMPTYAVILIRDGVGHSMTVDGKQLPGPLEFGHIMSLFHPGFSQLVSLFDRPGPGSFRWSWGRAGRVWDTAVRGVPVFRSGNDRGGSGGLEGGERVVFHVVQGQDGPDHGGAAFRAAAQLGGQDFPVLQAGVAAFADAAQLGLQPVRGPLCRGQVLAARLAAAGDHRLVPAEVAQVGEDADDGGEDGGDPRLPRRGDVHGGAGLRGRGPQQLPGRGADGLHVQPVPLVLAGIEGGQTKYAGKRQ
jgi:hypothetical protein